MKLHLTKSEFDILASLASEYKGISVLNVKRDYLIVLLLQRLEKSEFKDKCVFKGGTSLSKGYPGSISRFSEDIDLTYLPEETQSDKNIEKSLKRIESVLSTELKFTKIKEERNQRNKSSFIWDEKITNEEGKIKLEIGSSINPFPYSKRKIKTIIQQYLEEVKKEKVCQKYELQEVEVNILGIERTFLDKVMAVKRHALCGTISRKTRHIYDVAALYKYNEITEFLSKKERLKDLLQTVKKTDSFYLEKRNIPQDYMPNGKYDFNEWKENLDSDIGKSYRKMVDNLLFKDSKTISFEEAVSIFNKINELFESIEE